MWAVSQKVSPSGSNKLVTLDAWSFALPMGCCGAGGNEKKRSEREQVMIKTHH
jgi:hypothetical protein